jgi:cell division protein FtsB
MRAFREATMDTLDRLGLSRPYRRHVRGMTAARAVSRLGRWLSPYRAQTRPAALVLSCLALVGLLALVYLGQVGAATAANQRLQALQAEQAQLARQDEQLREQLAVMRSPAYIDRRARALGLVPAPAGAAVVIVLPGVGGPSGQAAVGETGGAP